MDFANFDTLRITAAMLYDARRNARLTPAQAADLCGIHRTTYERQENGKSRVNVTVYRLILTRAGWLPAPLEGWSIGQNKLWTPEGVALDPGEIKALPYYYAMIAELKRRLARYEETPEPTRTTGDIGGNVVPFRLDSVK
jgi:transcriptional regulator with XRE-family HTH domain